jgi:hypothetical protein
MDMMTFIHANANREELGVLSEIREADIEITDSSTATVNDNSFSLTLDERVWSADPIGIGHYIYAPGTEFGGIVTELQHSTSGKSIVILGATWRGMLLQKVIEPPSGSAYKTVTNVDANAAILAVVGTSFGDLFTVSSAVAGVSVTGQWRYDTYGIGLYKVLSKYGLRLNVVYDNEQGSVVLSALPVVDYSDEIDLSQDYGVDFTSKAGRMEEYNRCIGLGRGELTERAVISVYRIGGTYYTAQPQGWVVADERATVLDYPNAETVEELTASALQRLSEFEPEQSISIDQIAASVDIQMGDIVGARDRMTGMVAKSAIVRKILTIREGVLQIEAKAG